MKYVNYKRIKWKSKKEHRENTSLIRGAVCIKKILNLLYGIQNLFFLLKCMEVVLYKNLS